MQTEAAMDDDREYIERSDLEEWLQQDREYQDFVDHQTTLWIKEAKELLEENGIKAWGHFGLRIEDEQVKHLIDLLKEYSELAVGM